MGCFARFISGAGTMRLVGANGTFGEATTKFAGISEAMESQNPMIGATCSWRPTARISRPTMGRTLSSSTIRAPYGRAAPTLSRCRRAPMSMRSCRKSPSTPMAFTIMCWSSATNSVGVPAKSSGFIELPSVHFALKEPPSALQASTCTHIFCGCVVLIGEVFRR